MLLTRLAMKLELKTVLWLLVSLLVFGTQAVAQDDQDPVPDPGAGSSIPRGGKKAPRTNVPVTITIDGVSPESAVKLREEVLKVAQGLFTCPSCQTRSREAGKCSRCETDLVEAEDTPLVMEAKLTIDRRFMTVTLNPHHWGSLSEFDLLLKQVGGSVRREPFLLPDYARILVSCEKPISATRLRTALVDLKTFPAVSVDVNPDGKSAWVTPRSLSGPTSVGAFQEALSKMSTKYVVEDVQWAAYCNVCNAKSTLDLGSPTCRSH